MGSIGNVNTTTSIGLGLLLLQVSLSLVLFAPGSLAVRKNARFLGREAGKAAPAGASAMETAGEEESEESMPAGDTALLEQEQESQTSSEETAEERDARSLRAVSCIRAEQLLAECAPMLRSQTGKALLDSRPPDAVRWAIQDLEQEQESPTFTLGMTVEERDAAILSAASCIRTEQLLPKCFRMLRSQTNTELLEEEEESQTTSEETADERDVRIRRALELSDAYIRWRRS